MIESEERDVGSGQHVLVVDDDVHALERVRKHLLAAGFRVSVTDVAENLDSRIAIIGPDVVLLDVLMPGLCTKSLQRVLEAHAMDGEPRIVLLSPIPPATLMSLIDTSGAFAVVQVTKDEEFLEQLVTFSKEFSIAPSESVSSQRRPAPLVSGKHRIGGGRVMSDPSELQKTGGHHKRG